MLAKAGGSSVSHTSVADMLLHDLTGSTASSTVDLGGYKSALVGTQPTVQAHAPIPYEAGPEMSFRSMMAHLFTDHFVALP
jgi:hypothetical protein